MTILRDSITASIGPFPVRGFIAAIDFSPFSQKIVVPVLSSPQTRKTASPTNSTPTLEFMG
jgi:hypothetical protein